ncbi:MAG TPA: c-type cytochrome [Gammaproteobacteria bacterium]|nr:c-type cytochrome [Gammaproteobacteria bacterium]
MASISAGRVLAGLGLLALPLCAPAADLGATIAKQGNGEGATACATCHGADGSGQGAAGFPRLAGLPQAYLAKQLRSFGDGSRANATMKPIANALSAKEIKAVAAYYGGMEPPAKAPGAAGASAERKAAGEAIAKRGLWAKDVPACTKCHGPDGRGVGDNFPPLAGQHASYIRNQIDAWQSDKRSNDPNQLMSGVAQRLSSDEAAAVAAYFASLPAEPTDQ